MREHKFNSKKIYQFLQFYGNFIKNIHTYKKCDMKLINDEGDSLAITYAEQLF
jgi:hypothetical protein